MKPIIIVGYRGRMAKSLVEVVSDQKLPYFHWSDFAPKDSQVNSLEGSGGVIDFSSPERSKQMLSLAAKAKVPYVCGTTGWALNEKLEDIFAKTSKLIPVFYESNFSIGIEMLGRALDALGDLSGHKIYLTDVHHRHKKDSPSGTAKKLHERMKSHSSKLDLEFRDYRIGENAGEHTIEIDLGEEVLSFSHRAFNRNVFARGAVRALEWLQKKPAGFYRMKDMLS